MEIRERIGATIASIRKEKKMTQIELAQKSGVSESAIRGVELGKFSARIDILQKIAEALDCEIHVIKRSAYILK